MRTYHIACWNLENLFDEENAGALGRRTDKVFRAIKNHVVGWTPQLRDRKIDPACLGNHGDEHRPPSRPARRV